MLKKLKIMAKSLRVQVVSARPDMAEALATTEPVTGVTLSMDLYHTRSSNRLFLPLNTLFSFVII